jgi:hypothetical protein
VSWDWTELADLSEHRPWLGIGVSVQNSMGRSHLGIPQELRGHEYELAGRHTLSRDLIRLWIRKCEAGEFNDEVAEAVRVADY